MIYCLYFSPKGGTAEMEKNIIDQIVDLFRKLTPDQKKEIVEKVREMLKSK